MSNIELIEKLYNDYYLGNNAFKILMNECKISKELVLREEVNIELSEEKLISIIIPTYNRAEQLKECIESILMQNYNNYEIIVVDDGSTDYTEDIIKKMNDDRIKFIRKEKNTGASESRRIGFEKSQGDYIIFCDDDDYYIDESYFKKITKHLEDVEVNAVISNSIIKVEKENKYIFNNLNIADEIYSNKYLNRFQYDLNKPNSTFSFAIRKEIMLKAIKNMKMINDSSIYINVLLQKGKIKKINEIIGVYRIHSKNISANINLDFLFQNLEEKLRIYTDEKKQLENPEKWIYSQIRLTEGYYILGSMPKYRKIKKIIKWNNRNLKLNNRIKLNKDIFFLNLKKIIKKYLINK